MSKNSHIFGKTARKASVTKTIHALASILKAQLREFIDQFSIDILIVENALTIPMHVPLGIALTELIASRYLQKSDSEMPAVAVRD